MRTVVCRIPIQNTSRPPATPVDPRPGPTGEKPDRRAASQVRWGGAFLWPWSENVTVLIGFMVAFYVAFLCGWFAGYEAGQVLR